MTNVLTRSPSFTIDNKPYGAIVDGERPVKKGI